MFPVVFFEEEAIDVLVEVSLLNSIYDCLGLLKSGVFVLFNSTYDQICVLHVFLGDVEVIEEVEDWISFH